MLAHRIQPSACLKVPFRLDGDRGLFAYLERVLDERGHAVLCVAEGAGQVSSALPITETNRMQLVLCGMQNRTFGQ
jgi:hypothetical protein